MRGKGYMGRYVICGMDGIYEREGVYGEEQDIVNGWNI